MTNTLWMITSLTILISLLLNVLVLTYLAHDHLENIERLLPNCKFVQENRSMYSTAGILGKTMRLCMIAGMLSTPKFYLRRNLADPIDTQDFPRKTKRLILFFWYYLILSVLSLIIFESFTRHAK